MEEFSGEYQHKSRNISVAVKEVGPDDPNVEIIAMTDALIQVLIQDPVCGRSDYSDLPGVRGDVRSSWRSFDQYPRHSSTWQGFPRRQGSSSVTSEEQSRRKYEAKIRREKITIQRLAKRERLRAQQQDRKKQQKFLARLQNQGHACEKGGKILSNPGVIISSPKKGSAKRPSWRGQFRSDDKYQKKTYSHGGSEDSKSEGISHFGSVEDRSKYNNNRQQTPVDDTVSTSSSYQTDGFSENSLTKFVNPALERNLPNSLGENNNSVTSSSEDSAEKSLTQISSKSAHADQDSSLSYTHWKVTSTTAPEIADADSSTSKPLRRRTRNVKRVNYTEMLEDDFEQDEEEQSWKESKTSGRKIRPVKRTLEKAIVDASMKKIPRKKKNAADTKSLQSEPSSVPKIEGESNSGKRAEVFQNVLSAAVQNIEGLLHDVNVSARDKHSQLIPASQSAHLPGYSLSVPVPATSTSEQQSLMFSFTTGKLPMLSTLPPGSSLFEQACVPSLFENTSPQSAASAPPVVPFDQQLFLAHAGHTSSNENHIVPPSSLQNPVLTNSMSSVMHLPQHTLLQASNKYPVSSFSLPQRIVEAQITHPPGFPLQPRTCGVYNISGQPVASPPNFLLEHQTITLGPSNSEACSIGASHLLEEQAEAEKQRHSYKNSGEAPVMSDKCNTGNLSHIKGENSLNFIAHLDNSHIPSISTDLKGQKVIVSGAGRAAEQERHFPLSPIKTVPRSNLPAQTVNDVKNTSRNGAGIKSYKRQSQLDVESMLQSVNSSAKNTATSNCEILARKEKSPEIKSAQNNKFIVDLRDVRPSQCSLAPKPLLQKGSGSTHDQSLHPGTLRSHLAQSSEPLVCPPTSQMTPYYHQALQRSQSKYVSRQPPPLISVSDLYRFPTSLAPCNRNQVSTAPLNSMNMRLPLAHQNKLAGVTAADDLRPLPLVSPQKSVVVHERMLSQQDGSQQRFLFSEQSDSNSQLAVFSTSQQQSMQPPLLKPGHSGFQSQADKKRHLQGSSSSRHFSLSLNEPAINSPLSLTYPVPKEKSFSGLISDHVQQASVVEKGVSQFKEPIHPALQGAYRHPFRPAHAVMQQGNFHNKKQSLPPDIRNTLSNQVPAAHQKPYTLGFQEIPCHMQEKSKPHAPDLCVLNQVSSLGDHFPARSNHDRRTVQKATYTSENNGDTYLASVGSQMQCLVSVGGSGQGSHQMVAQKAPATSPCISLSHPPQKAGATLPHVSVDRNSQRTNVGPTTGELLLSDNHRMPAPRTTQEVDVKPIKSTLLQAVDLSHKISHGKHDQQPGVTAPTPSSTNSSSVTSHSGPVQMQAAPPSKMYRASHDHPLARSQIKQELMSQQDESDNSGVLQPDRQKSQAKICPASAVSLMPHNQNSSSISSLTELREVAASQETVPNDTLPLSQTSVYGSSCMRELVYAKEVNHASSWGNPKGAPLSSLMTGTVTASNIYQASPPTEHLQVPLTTLATSESQVTDSSENLRQSFENLKSVETSSVLNVGINTVAQIGRNSLAQSGQSITVEPQHLSHVQVKQEMRSDLVMKKSTDGSESLLQLTNITGNKCVNLSKHSDIGAFRAVPPSRLSDTATGRTILPSQPSDTATGRTIHPSQPSDTATGRTILPSQPSDTATDRTILPSQPSDTAACRTILLSQPSDTATSEALVPSQSSDTAAGRTIPPSQPSDTATSEALRPSQSSDTAAGRTILLSQPSDTATSEALLPSQSSDTAACRTILPSQPSDIRTIRTVPSSQPSNTIMSSSKQASCSTALFSNTAVVSDSNKPAVKTPDPGITGTVASGKSQQNAVLVKSVDRPVLVADTDESDIFTVAVSAGSMDNVTSASNFQPLVAQTAHAYYQHTSTHSDSASDSSITVCMQEPTQSQHVLVKGENITVSDNTLQTTDVNSPANTFTPEPAHEVTLASKSAYASDVTAGPAVTSTFQASSDSNPSSDKSPKENTTSGPSTATVISPQTLVSSLNKHAVAKTPLARSHTVTNDPLFAWYADSPRHWDSFLLDDITSSESLFGDSYNVTNNMYSVTVSVPCSEGGAILPCHSSPADLSAVKVEPNTQTASLNQREVIDLSVSDNEEDDLIDGESPSCTEFLYQASTSSASCQQKTLGINKTSYLVSDLRYKHSSDRSQGQQCSQSSAVQQSVASDLQAVTDTPGLEKMPVIPSSGSSNFVAGQIIMSPLTGQKVIVTDEQRSYIQNRLARVNADLSSITSGAGDFPNSSDTYMSPVIASSVQSDEGAGRSGFIDIQSSPSVQMSVNKNIELANDLSEPTQPVPSSISENREQTAVSCALRINTEASEMTRKQAVGGVMVKKERVEEFAFRNAKDIEEREAGARSELLRVPSASIQPVNSAKSSAEHSSGAPFSETSKSLLSPDPPASSSSVAPQKDICLSSESRLSLKSPSQKTGQILASIANWSNEEVAQWLKNHKLDQICPNLSSLDGRGLQRMAFEHQRDPDMFYTRVKKTLGLTFFQTMVICRSMKELNDGITDDC